MVGQQHNMVEYSILSQIFPVEQYVRCVFRLVRQSFILVGHCPMSDRYFKTWMELFQNHAE